MGEDRQSKWRKSCKFTKALNSKRHKTGSVISLKWLECILNLGFFISPIHPSFTRRMMWFVWLGVKQDEHKLKVCLTTVKQNRRRKGRISRENRKLLLSVRYLRIRQILLAKSWIGWRNSMVTKKSEWRLKNW